MMNCEKLSGFCVDSSHLAVMRASMDTCQCRSTDIVLDALAGCETTAKCFSDLNRDLGPIPID